MPSERQPLSIGDFFLSDIPAVTRLKFEAPFFSLIKILFTCVIARYNVVPVNGNISCSGLGVM